jgi:hypothetical protein
LGLIKGGCRRWGGRFKCQCEPSSSLSTCTIRSNLSRAATPTPFFVCLEVIFVFTKLANIQKFYFAPSFATDPPSPPKTRFTVRSSAAEHKEKVQHLPSTFIRAPLVCKSLIAPTRPSSSHFLLMASLLHSSKRCVRPSQRLCLATSTSGRMLDINDKFNTISCSSY